MTRVHAPGVEVLAKQEGEQWVLRSPAPGWFLPAQHLTLVARGDVIGELDVLGRRTRLVAPDVTGLASTTPELLLARSVGHGDPLVVLGPAAHVAGSRTTATEPTHAAAGLVFRAPTSGRFYGRATPEKPPFVAVGDELGQGATVCMLEVMKTFHRVTYGGAGLPERARVREILIADGADVTAGEPLLALEPT